MAAIVPELRKKIAEQEKRGEAWKAELVEANKQLVNLKLKHLEREKEWQNIEEQNVRLLEKRNMMVEHLREELMLQRQIAHLAPGSIEKVQIMSTGGPVFRSFFE